jgi:hypothetical protein
MGKEKGPNYDYRQETEIINGMDMIKQEIFDIEPAETKPQYWKKGGSYKGKDPRNHYKVDIENKGLTCGTCKFNCTLEKALIYFTRRKNSFTHGGDWRPDVRSGYNANCKPCSNEKTRRYNVKKNLERDINWKPRVIAFYDEINAECTKCKEILLHSEFGAKASNGLRPVAPTCKTCTSDITFEQRRRDIKTTTYRRYKYQMRKEGNDHDMTYEEFERDVWPYDNRCPILGHKLRYYPIEERGQWAGGRHYPYTPCVDHIDPREELSKNNVQVISWRANELKGDAIPEEIHLLSIYMKDIFSIGDDVLEDFRHKETLRQTGWVGKYPDRY